MKKIILCFLLLFFNDTINLCGQDSISTILNADIKELLNTKIDIIEEENISTGAFKETNLRELGGIVSVISTDMIRNTAARDVLELLRMVAGIDFGVENSDGQEIMMFRGIQGASGGVLVMQNGIMMNDIGYNGYLFLNRISLDNIEKIEIIRGAGAMIYGGTASLAVINILTKKYEQGIGTTVSVQSGISDNQFSRTNLSFTFAQKYNNEVQLTLSAFKGFNKKSNAIENYFINDSTQTTINFADSSLASTSNMSFGLKYKNLQIRLMYDQFTAKHLYEKGSLFHEGVYAFIQNEFKIGKKITFTPSYTFRVQQPWSYVDYEALASLYNIIAYRNATNGVFSYQVKPQILFSLGYSFYEDRISSKDPNLTLKNNFNHIKLNNIAVFTETVVNSKFGNFILGLRLDKYSASKSILIPRLAYTKIYQNFHFKALYSFSFRNPTAAEYAEEPSLQAQRSKNIEFEIGYKWKDRWTFTANIFSSKIFNVITYVYNDSTLESKYYNDGYSGTNGFESEIKYKNTNLSIIANYSYYLSNYSGNGLLNFIFPIAYEQQVKDVIFSDDRTQFLGAYKHKFTAQMSYKFSQKINLSGLLVFRSKSIILTDINDDVKYSPTLPLFNLNMSYRDFFIKGLAIDLGIFNLMNQPLTMISHSNILPLPQREHNREFVVKFRYNL